MVVGKAILLLLGTINAFTTAIPIGPTEIIIEKHIDPKFAEKLPQYGLQGYPPFISKFMEYGTNIFFKPQILLSPALAPGQKVIFNHNNKEDCMEWSVESANPIAATPQIVSDEPLKIVETVVFGGELPTVEKVVIINPSQPKITERVPPLVISPLPAITEELVEVPVSNPMERPIVSEPVVYSTGVIEESEPAIMPEAPELPPLPVSEMLNTSLPSVPVVEPVPYIESYDNIVSMDIPQAPKLPHFTPPKLPLPVVMTEALIECDEQNKIQSLGDAPIIIESQETVLENLDPLIIPPALPPAAEIITPETVIQEKPVVIPPVPVLPEFQDSILMETPVADVVVSHQEEDKPIFPITVPDPTELTPVPCRDVPINLVIPEPVPAIPELPHLTETKPLEIEDKFEVVEIPASPVLPPMEPISLPISIMVTNPFNVQELPPSALNEIHNVDSLPPADLSPIFIDIPEAPKLPPYTPPKLPLPVVIPEVLIDCDKQNKTQTLDEAPILIESQETVAETLEHLETPPPVLPPSAEIIVSQPVIEEKPVFIPPAPVLHEFQETILMDTPVSGVIVSHQEEVKPISSISMPDPTEFTPVPCPDLPHNFVIPEPVPAVPELPYLTETKPLVIEDKFEGIEIPAPPVLPPMEPISLPISITAVEPLEVPELPLIASNEIPNAEFPEYGRPIFMPETPMSTFDIPKETTIQKETMSNPAAPELSSLPFPTKPIIMALYPPAGFTPMFIEEPKLPEKFGNGPLFMTFPEHVRLPLSEVQSIVSFPTTCVQNIVVERILPNIVKEGRVEVFSSSNYPVISSYAPIINRVF